jgi:hypothetical protein
MSTEPHAPVQGDCDPGRRSFAAAIWPTHTMEIFVSQKKVSERLADDVRQGAHARKVMESDQTWFGGGPELSVLRMMLGLFDSFIDMEPRFLHLKDGP